jgi:tyrosinase
MYLEGFRPNDQFPCYTDGRCARHGLGHVYIGGDMVNGGNPMDPTFFLHHANVDRIWAMWQDNNRQNPDTAVDYGNPGFPGLWRISLFNFPDVMVEEMFDFRALGYEYDTSPEQ